MHNGERKLNRINALKNLAFEKNNHDAFFIANEHNLLYLTGTPGATCLLIPKKGENTLYSYGVNYDQTKAEAKDCKVELIKRGEKLTDKIAPQFKAYKTKKLATDTTNHDFYRLLAKAVRGKAQLKTQGNLVWELRKIKDPQEQELMRKAAKTTATEPRLKQSSPQEHDPHTHTADAPTEKSKKATSSS